MFALEINFNDGVSSPETLLVRRPHAIVGSSEFAHVVIEGSPSLPCELRVSRGLGRQFQCQPLKKSGGPAAVSQVLEGVYSGDVQLALGNVSTHITALDNDLLMQPGESPDRAGVRVLRSALTRPSPLFPAVAVLGALPVFVSFPPDEPLVVGRSRKCGLRLDSSGISGEHARIGFENGEFWVEDLGSTNGTFVGSAPVSGRTFLGSVDTVTLGNEFVLAGVKDEADLRRLNDRVGKPSPVLEEELFPCVFSTSDLIRPNRVVLMAGRKIHIGRDPASEIWVGAPHISRNHAVLEVAENGQVTLTDLSTNGTYLDGERLDRNQTVSLVGELAVIDLKQGMVLAVCHNEGHEEEFQREENSTVAPGGEMITAAEGVGESNATRIALVTPSVSEPNVFQTLAEREGNRIGATSPDTKGLWEEDRLGEAGQTSSFEIEDGQLGEQEDITEYPRIGGKGGLLLKLTILVLVAVVLGLFGLLMTN